MPPLTCLIIGAGNRGIGYSRYADIFPDQMKVRQHLISLFWQSLELPYKYNIDSSCMFVWYIIK